MLWGASSRQPAGGTAPGDHSPRHLPRRRQTSFARAVGERRWGPGLFTRCTRVPTAGLGWWLSSSGNYRRVEIILELLVFPGTTHPFFRQRNCDFLALFGSDLLLGAADL